MTNLSKQYNQNNHKNTQTQEGGLKNKAQASSLGNKTKEQTHGQENKAREETKSTNKQTRLIK